MEEMITTSFKIIICVQQKKKTHTGLEQLEGGVNVFLLG